MWQRFCFQPLGWLDCNAQCAAYWLVHGGQVRLV